MPSPEEEAARIFDRLEGRVSRLEGANTEEAVPNPLLEFSETTRSTDSFGVEATSAGSAQWDASQWNVSEWNPPGGN